MEPFAISKTFECRTFVPNVPQQELNLQCEESRKPRAIKAHEQLRTTVLQSDKPNSKFSYESILIKTDHGFHGVNRFGTRHLYELPGFSAPFELGSLGGTIDCRGA